MTAQPIAVAPDYTPTAPLVRLLGPMNLVGYATPTAAQERQTLALLAVNAGHHVSMEMFEEELWSERRRIRKPAQAIQTYVGHLRKHPVLRIETRRRGYVLLCDPDLVDATRFETLVGQARREYRAGLTSPAQDTLRAAFSLWTGRVLEDVERGPLLASWAAGITDKFRTARELGWDIALQGGRHRDVLDELRAAVWQDWTAEPLALRLMIALYRAGRRAEGIGGGPDCTGGAGRRAGARSRSRIGAVAAADPVGGPGTRTERRQGMSDEPETCVVWYVRYGTDLYEVFDDEESAAFWSVTTSDSGEASIYGVQFRDGRLIQIEDWAAFDAEFRRRLDDERKRSSLAPAARRPTRTGLNPFNGRSVEVDAEEPDWVGITQETPNAE